MFTHSRPVCVSAFLTKEMQAASSRIRTSKSSNCSSTSSHRDFPEDQNKRRTRRMKEEEGRTHEMKTRERGRISGRSRKRGLTFFSRQLWQETSQREDNTVRSRQKQTLQCYSTSNASMIDRVCWRCCVDINKLRWVYRWGPIAPGSSSAARSSDLSTRWRQRNPEPPPPSWCERCPSLTTSDETDTDARSLLAVSSRKKKNCFIKTCKFHTTEVVKWFQRHRQKHRQEHGSQLRGRGITAARGQWMQQRTVISQQPAVTQYNYTQFYMSTTVQCYYSN